MFNFGWVDRHPIRTFVTCLLILLYIYGISWTIVIIFSFFLLDVTFKDTQGEKIHGKPLLAENKYKLEEGKPIILTPRVGGFTEQLVEKKKMSKNEDTGEKRPTLQSLLYKRSTQPENTQQYARQPLTAIIKSNISLKSSPTIDLDKKKPLYQTFRSPVINRVANSPCKFTPTSLSGGVGSPFARKFNDLGLSSNSGTPFSLSKNTSNITTDGNANDTLEVHGSYFINKSILHSPSLERPNLVQRQFNSPSTNITFDIRSPRTDFTKKCTTESVVEVLKSKSKRKRGLQESFDETSTKKKKENEELDSTMQDLLPNEKTSGDDIASIKRKTLDVTSMGIQCEIDTDMTCKKVKLNKGGSAKKKFGLSQGEVNDLSKDTDSVDGALDKPNDVSDLVVTEKDTSGITGILGEISKSLSAESSLKTVAFADTTQDKIRKEPVSDSSSISKLSGLKKINSPYKKLFNGNSNLSPALRKKMRKHPVYFTAKINIDELQQHHEEFGESGVSLKAFRLDKEEANKRIDSLFDDVETSTPPAEPVPPSATVKSTDNEIKPSTTISLFSSSKTGLLGALAQPASSTSTSSVSSVVVSTSSLSDVQSSETAATVSVVEVVSVSDTVATSSDSTIKFGNEAPKFSESISKPLQPGISSFSFGTPVSTTSLDSSLFAKEVSSEQPTSSLSGPSTTSSVGFTFGAAKLTTDSLPPQSLQSNLADKAEVVSNLSNVPCISSSEPPAVTTTPSFGISVMPAPSTSAESFSFSSNAAVTSETSAVTHTSTLPVISFSAAPPSTGANMFGSNTSGFGFGLSSVSESTPSVPSLPLFGKSETSGNLFSSVQSAPDTKTLPTATAGTVAPAPSSVSSFSFGTSAPQPNLNSALFGASSAAPVATLASTFMFGNVSLAPISVSTLGPTFAPSLAAPSLAAPSLAAPSFAAPSLDAPSLAAPSLAAQSLAAPSLAAPSLAAPSFAPVTSVVPPVALATSLPTLAPVAAPATAPLNTSVPSFNLPSTSIANVFAQGSTGGTGSTGGFSFSTSTPSNFSFGANSSVQPAATSQNNIFGQAPVAPNVSLVPTTQQGQNIFGGLPASSASSQSIFGSTQQPSSTGLFGGEPVSSAPASQGVFGSSQTNFGSSVPNSTFGGAPASQNSTFGTAAPSSQSAFGVPQPQPSIFGDQTKPTGFNFGTSAISSAPSTGFSFGASTTQVSSSVFGAPTSNVFGAANSAPNGGAVFGQAKPAENVFAQQTKPASGFDFSASLTQGPSLNFGSPAPAVNGFAPQSEVPKPNFNFGAQPATPSFGANTPASPAFGTGQPPSFAAQPFGAPNPGNTGGFTIGAGGSNPPPTRQTQRARRRLRR